MSKLTLQEQNLQKTQQKNFVSFEEYFELQQKRAKLSNGEKLSLRTRDTEKSNQNNQINKKVLNIDSEIINVIFLLKRLNRKF